MIDVVIYYPHQATDSDIARAMLAAIEDQSGKLMELVHAESPSSVRQYRLTSFQSSRSYLYSLTSTQRIHAAADQLMCLRAKFRLATRIECPINVPNYRTADSGPNKHRAHSKPRK